MNGLALCAGAGGLELGLHIAVPEYRTVGYVEREAFAASTLVARMEDATLAPAPVWDDVATFDGRRWRGVVDIVAGGYPCQGESNAGRRLGVRDPRWLWPHFRRVLVQSGAEWGFFENVGAHLSRSFPVVAGDLARLGFRVAAGLFTSKEAGRNHERERLFILAHCPRRGCGEFWHAARTGRGGHPHCGGATVAHSHQVGWGGRPGLRAQGHGEAEQPAEDGGGNLARTGGDGRGAGRQDHPEHVGAVLAAGREHAVDMAHASLSGLAGAEQPGQPGQAERRLGARATAAELRGALPLAAPGPADPSWPVILDLDPTLEPSIHRMADGMAYRVDRLRLTGNGVDPLAAALAFCTLRDALAWRPGAVEAALPAVMGAA